jgi:predicted DNA-binding transcriptional regulator AlpA
METLEQVVGKRLIDVNTLAEILDMSPRTIRNGVAPKSKRPFPIKAKRIGKLVKFDVRDVDAYLESL